MTFSKLVAANKPQEFWQLTERFPDSLWTAAVAKAQLKSNWSFPTPLPIDAFLEQTLGEGQFGANRYQLAPALKSYYTVVRPLIPAAARPMIRRVWRARKARDFMLRWPREDRYAKFLYDTLSAVLAMAGRDAVEMTWLWPDRAHFAVCLTHDVEAREGHDFVPRVMDLEERHGVRSCFNFVAADYPVDGTLIEHLRERGFEVGVHGYTHSGRLFSSREAFLQSLETTHKVARGWGATGFRSPLTHREPVWMQSLDMDYDMSFFDTDPYEPMPGGTMSIWPFTLGRFIELPYTLPQDHTLFEITNDPLPIWRQKLEFIRAYHGMALVNVHPDYLRDEAKFQRYEELLGLIGSFENVWTALPREIAGWWRSRSSGRIAGESECVTIVRSASDDGLPARAVLQ